MLRGFLVTKLSLVILGIIFSGVASAQMIATGAWQRNSSISGSVTTDTTNVNLTALGTTDWAFFDSDVTNPIRRSGGGSRINANISLSDHNFGDDMRTYSWTGGVPTASGSDKYGSIDLAGVGAGFEFSVPASNKERRVKIYLGMLRGTATLTATLSDGSAAPFTATMTSSGVDQRTYTLTYSAAAPNAILNVSYVLTSDGGGGNVFLSSVALEQTGSTVSSGAISGTYTNITVVTPVDLNAEGPEDWVHQGSYDVVRKSGANLIGPIYTLSYGGWDQAGQTKTFSWTGGTPQATGTNVDRGVRQPSGMGTTFRVVVPASTSPQTLRLYLHKDDAAATLRAFYSDGSPATYTDSPSRVAGTTTHHNYTLTFRSAKPNTNLIVTWTKTTTSGWVGIRAAALSSP